MVVGATMVGTTRIAAAATLKFERNIKTRPFAGTSMAMNDNEGIAYVPADDMLWVIDDSRDRLHSVNRTTGVLGQTLIQTQFDNAHRFGTGELAGPDRTDDLEAVAYDAGTDTLYAFSGNCCTSAARPTVFRLKRSGGSGPFTIDSWQPLNAPYNDLSGAEVRNGVLWAANGTTIVAYDFVSNTTTTPIVISGATTIYGVGFSPDGADMWLAMKGNVVRKYDWATKSAVSGASFSMSSLGVQDARAVSQVGNELYICDGYDYYGSVDTAFAIRVYSLGTGAGAITPVASFTRTPATGAAPLAVSFTDTSTNTPTAWSWNFGDGSSSTAHNPSHTYTTPGTYSVRLTASNAAGSNTSAALTVVVSGAPTPPPVASFTSTATAGTAPLAVTFTDTSTNTPTSWSWNFGDGTSSTVRNPSHTYTTPGTYSVVLTATNAGGSDASNTTSIVVSPAVVRPVASFTKSASSGPAPLTVSFTDTSTNTPTSWSWNFGDGTTSSQQNPSKTYSSPGSFAVTLTATNAGGSSSSAAQTVTVAGGVGTTTFTPSMDSYVSLGTPTTTRATATTLYNLKSSTNEHRSFVKFAVSGVSGTVSSAKLRLWVTEGTVDGAPWYRLADDSWLDTTLVWNNAPSVAAGTLVGNPGVVPISTWLEIDVTAVVTGNGTFSFATLPTSSDSERFASKEATNKPQLVITTGGPMAPVASFTKSAASGVAPLAVNFTDTSTNAPTSWAWDFGDGTTSSAKNPSKTYSGAGTFNVTLTATNATGSNTSVAQTVTVSAPPEVPVASFTATATTGAAPLAVSFTDTSTNTPTSWSWSFGDGATSTSQNPSHTYTAPGTYDVQLTATNGAGSSTSAITQIVVDPPLPQPPVASGTASPATGPAPLIVSFADTSANVPTSWSWDFGDGETSTDQHPTHTFANPGTYQVVLTATNGQGSDASDPIVVQVSTSGAGRFVFAPSDDAYVDSSVPTSPKGTSSTLYNLASTAKNQRSYLRFRVTGVTGTVVSAKLRLWLTDGTDNAARWYRIPESGWTEGSLTWANAPAVTGALVANPGAVTDMAWVEIDVSLVVNGDGTYSFATLPESANAEKYSTKESTNPPELVIVTS